MPSSNLDVVRATLISQIYDPEDYGSILVELAEECDHNGEWNVCGTICKPLNHNFFHLDDLRDTVDDRSPYKKKTLMKILASKYFLDFNAGLEWFNERVAYFRSLPELNRVAYAAEKDEDEML